MPPRAPATADVVFVLGRMRYDVFYLLRRYVCFHYDSTEQEAQLLQRGRAMLRVIEYFAKAFKVIQGHRK